MNTIGTFLQDDCRKGFANDKHRRGRGIACSHPETEYFSHPPLHTDIQYSVRSRGGNTSLAKGSRLCSVTVKVHTCDSLRQK